MNVIEAVADGVKNISSGRVAVGVSGGRDSMCLLHALVKCVDKSRVAVVHVNHRLRPTAQRDEDFVRDFCDRNGLEFHAVRVDVRREAENKGLTTEQAARSLRYDALFDFVKSGRADFIMTAHHALDNAESVLMHMFRGAGLDGLRGMEKLDFSRMIVRPLIDVYPVELDAYAAENGISYVTDETNLSDDADRNFLRLNVIPLIEKRYRGAVGAINELARESARACKTLDALVDRNKIVYDRGAYVIALDALEGDVASRYVRRAVKNFSLTDVTREQIDSVIRLFHARVGAVAELANGVKAAREATGVAVYVPRPPFAGEFPVRFGTNAIDGLAVEIRDTNADVKSVVGGIVDAEKLEGASLRFRRDGDVFTPCGSVGKKLKQFFTDKKIPNRIKDRTPLICRGNEVLVVVGMQISDKVKVTDGTKRRAAVECMQTKNLSDGRS